MSKKSRQKILNYIIGQGKTENIFLTEIYIRYEKDREMLINKYKMWEEQEFPELEFKLINPSKDDTELAYIIGRMEFYKNYKNNWEFNRVHLDTPKIIINVINLINELDDLITDKLVEEITNRELEKIILEYTRNIILHEMIHYIQMDMWEYKIELPQFLNKITTEHHLYKLIIDSPNYNYHNFLIEFLCISDWYEIIKEEYEGSLLNLYYGIMGIQPLLCLIYKYDNFSDDIKNFLLSKEERADYFEAAYLDKLEIIEENFADAIMEIVNFKIKCNNYLRNPNYYFNIKNYKINKFYPYYNKDKNIEVEFKPNLPAIISTKRLLNN